MSVLTSAVMYQIGSKLSRAMKTHLAEKERSHCDSRHVLCM